jgi:hypothetical protein
LFKGSCVLYLSSDLSKIPSLKLHPSQVMSNLPNSSQDTGLPSIFSRGICISFCSDWELITEEKLSISKCISSLLGLKDSCHSRRKPAGLLPPTSEIYLPTDVCARYRDQIWHFSGGGDNCRRWQASFNSWSAFLKKINLPGAVCYHDFHKRGNLAYRPGE